MTAHYFGRPMTYPLRDMAVGDHTTMPAPTAADAKRIHRNISQYGQRHDRAYRGRLDPASRILTITRLR